MVHGQEDAPKRYPGPRFYDEALADLHDSKRDGEVHIPTFARRTLTRLRNLGLLHTSDDEAPVNVRRVKRVKEGKEQELWIRFDTQRSEAGYMAVEVVDAPRSDTVILAAMTALIVQPVDFEQLLAALRFLHSQAYEEQAKKSDDIHRRIMESQEVSPSAALDILKLSMEHLAVHKTLEPIEYVLPLVKHYKPEIANYSPEEQWDLIEKTCFYVKEFLESLRKLQAFLEYGAPNGKLAPAIKEPRRADGETRQGPSKGGLR